MRPIKILSIVLLAAAAVVGGFVVAAVIAVATVAAWLVRRFVLKTAKESYVAAPRARTRAREASSDVIDVTATEVQGARRDP